MNTFDLADLVKNTGMIPARLASTGRHCDSIMRAGDGILINSGKTDR
jgi:hypothetical protein